MAEFTIREATSDDAGRISALIASLARYFLADPERPQDAAAFFETITPAAITDCIASGRYRYHLAEAAGELAGLVGVRDAGHLYHLMVAEPFHGQRIASALWEVANKAAAADGNTGRFTVNSSMNAVPVYERFGFTATGAVQVQNGIAFMPMELRRDSPARALDVRVAQDHLSPSPETPWPS
ncbi:GNAT family N-acetyltransferase [Longimicrobium sp.]|jgi:ribosomal protein S18 acetylase RimI-like enzyme|uniref:GNAT family N-acetyltransferase n=1 Tax=Longimicrobium sp. TaxID=2029185 RepID=UPI002F92EC5D